MCFFSSITMKKHKNNFYWMFRERFDDHTPNVITSGDDVVLGFFFLWGYLYFTSFPQEVYILLELDPHLTVFLGKKTLIFSCSATKMKQLMKSTLKKVVGLN